jgi:hypothetical protein
VLLRALPMLSEQTTAADMALAAEKALPWVLALTVGYVAAVRAYNQRQAKRAGQPPLWLQRLAAGWNAWMAVFSAGGVYYMYPIVSGADGCLLWLALYVFTKPAEYLDTVFLMLKGRPVILLHWTHHAITSLYVLYATVFLLDAGVYFAFMNYCVHAVMYGYYAVLHFPAARRMLRPWSGVVTCLQMSQFVAALVLAFRMPAASSGSGTWYHHTTVVTLAMYVYYLGIFARFFYARHQPKALGGKGRRDRNVQRRLVCTAKDEKHE